MKNLFYLLLGMLCGFSRGYSQCNTALIISQGRPAFASSVENASYQPGNAFDGDRTTRWSSAFSDPQYLYVDLGAVTSLCQVNLIWENAYGKDFTIDISDDATTWTNAATITGNSSLTNNIPISGNGRYVRMYGTARGTPNGYSLYGMHVYGTAPSPFCGGTNLALAGAAVSSSDENIAFPASKAFDGDGATRWSSQASDPQFVYVDLADTYNLCNVNLSWETAYATDFHIDVSQDAANWATLATVTGNTSMTNSIPVSGLARYVRMFGTARATGYGYSLYEFTVSGYNVLPVKLREFSAVAEDDNTVKLSWTTDQETNNDRFVIERSTADGSFISIGTVRGKGNSSVRTDYQWQDLPGASGIYRYRLRQVDVDEKSSYSTVATVTLRDQTSVLVSVYPNPATDQVTIKGLDGGKIESIFIYSTSGSGLMEVNTASATSSVNVSVKNLPDGIYVMKIKAKGQNRILKFVKAAR